MAKNKRIFEDDPEELESGLDNPAESAESELLEAIREMSGQMKGLRSDVGKFMVPATSPNNPPADSDPQPLTTDQVKAFLESEEGKSMLAGSVHLEFYKGQRAVNIFSRLRQIPEDIEKLDAERMAFTENGERKRTSDRKLAAALESEREELQAELEKILQELPEPAEPVDKKDKWNV